MTVSRREARAGWLFLLPWVVGFLAFTAGPMLFSLWLSLTHYDMLKPPTFIGLENYREAVTDERVGTALWNTVFYTALHVPAQIVLALALASLLRRAGCEVSDRISVRVARPSWVTLTRGGALPRNDTGRPPKQSRKSGSTRQRSGSSPRASPWRSICASSGRPREPDQRRGAAGPAGADLRR